ncbi:uncharacterized protein LOC110731947 [Chenopodium quinoa]|uniref:Late embryogenesis abundant protein LEA-2 subgroup domain-containing protein n=1 Tax=Chenopodium quinoa TaxID=63459 RepID=A0A803L3L8_CHEQI|nr:uncharacterized protein LOC110731947 [Chenopodium quinoa]
MDEKRRKRRRCWLVALGVVIGLVLLFSILGATVFKAKRPVTTVKSVSLHDMDVSFDALRMKVHLNVSLDASITVKNPNKVGLKFSDSSAFVDYRGQMVGQAPIPAGQISAGETLPMNLTLTVMADRLLSNSQPVISDLLAGTLPLTTRTRISGKVTLLFINIHVVSSASCNLNISVSTRSISDSDCTYNTRLS